MHSTLRVVLPFLLILGACSTAPQPETVDDEKSIVVYDVRDLIPPVRDVDLLASNVVDATDRKKWEGEGAQASMTTDDDGYLIVHATPRLHGYVEQVLKDLRRISADFPNGG